MSYHSHHRILTPGASRKRKETEAFYSVQPSTTTPPSPQPTSSSAQAAAADPISSNQILAGYMAYEFLTKGTLFGQKFDPARANALPLSPTSGATDLKKTKLNQNTVAAEPNNRAAPVKQHESYTEVASLLKADGAHIPGIVNPTQLARWIQM